MSENISTTKGIFVFSSTIIGAGILALPVAASSGGFFPLLFMLVLIAIASIFSALYISEAVMDTQGSPHLPSLAQRYLGTWGMVLMLLGTMVYIYGALAGYLAVGGQLLFALSDGIVPVQAGIAVYFGVGSLIVHYGLKLVSYVETYLFLVMIVLLGSVIAMSFPHIDVPLLVKRDWPSSLDAFGVVLFAYIGHSVLPSIANGLEKKRDIVKVASFGVLIPLVLYVAWALVVMGIVPAVSTTAYSLEQAKQAGQPATIPLGMLVGGSVVLLGNIFAVLSTMTSFIGFGFSLKEEYANVAGTCGRTLSMIVLTAVVVVPPLIVALLNRSGFIQALGVAGAYGGGIFAGILPALMVIRMRKRNAQERLLGRGRVVFPCIVLLVYLAGMIYTTVQLF